jgi:hypothetical protein
MNSAIEGDWSPQARAVMNALAACADKDGGVRESDYRAILSRHIYPSMGQDVAGLDHALYQAGLVGGRYIDQATRTSWTAHE